MLIAERVKARFKDQTLRDLVDLQTARGIEKYGQTLDANSKPVEAKAVHAIQEAVDLMQYLEWIKDDLKPEQAHLERVLDSSLHHLERIATILYIRYGQNRDLSYHEGFKEG